MYIENLKDLLAVSMRVLDAVVNIADVEMRILQPLRHYSEEQATQTRSQTRYRRATKCRREGVSNVASIHG